jgi:hypothetical protein
VSIKPSKDLFSKRLKTMVVSKSFCASRRFRCAIHKVVDIRLVTLFADLLPGRRHVALLVKREVPRGRHYGLLFIDAHPTKSVDFDNPGVAVHSLPS